MKKRNIKRRNEKTETKKETKRKWASPKQRRGAARAPRRRIRRRIGFPPGSTSSELVSQMAQLGQESRAACGLAFREMFVGLGPPGAYCTSSRTGREALYGRRVSVTCIPGVPQETESKRHERANRVASHPCREEIDLGIPSHFQPRHNLSDPRGDNPTGSLLPEPTRRRSNLHQRVDKYTFLVCYRNCFLFILNGIHWAPNSLTCANPCSKASCGGAWTSSHWSWRRRRWPWRWRRPPRRPLRRG
jgi:hypothetical protein